jgi:hypothetical protein
MFIFFYLFIPLVLGFYRRPTRTRAYATRKQASLSEKQQLTLSPFPLLLLLLHVVDVLSWPMPVESIMFSIGYVFAYHTVRKMAASPDRRAKTSQFPFERNDWIITKLGFSPHNKVLCISFDIAIV